MLGVRSTRNKMGLLCTSLSLSLSLSFSPVLSLSHSLPFFRYLSTGRPETRFYTICTLYRTCTVRQSWNFVSSILYISTYILCMFYTFSLFLSLFRTVNEISLEIWCRIDSLPSFPFSSFHTKIAYRNFIGPGLNSLDYSLILSSFALFIVSKRMES